MTAAADAPPSSTVDPSGARRRRILPVLARLALTIASGLALYASFEPRPLWWLAPLAFAGFGLVLYGRKVLASAGYGAVFALAFFLAHLRWIQDFLGAEFGIAPWLGLCAVLAAYLAVACALMPLAARLPGAPVWLALLFLLQEYLRQRWPIHGFPWGRVGFSQPEGAYLPLASVGGAPLVGFAVVVTGFGLAWLIMRVRDHGWRPTRAWAVPAAAVVVPVCAGLALWPTVGTEAQAGTRTVAVVQGNAPDVGIELLGRREEIRANHLAESGRLLARIRAGEVPEPDFVVWPETSTDVSGPDPAIDSVMDAFGVPGVLGALYTNPETGKAANSVVTWLPGEGMAQRYVKRELVPFAEHVPMRSIASWFTPFVGNTRDMRWGTEPAALEVAGTAVAPVICYETAYDYVARDNVKAGGELLVVPTNNAWYGPGEMSHQHLAMSRVRAVEHGRAAVVAATSGISAIVEPDGSVRERTGLYTATSLVADVPLRRTITLADQLGPWTEYVLVGAGLLAAAAGLLRRRAAGEMTERNTHGGGPPARG